MTHPTPAIEAAAKACFAELDELSMMPSVIERHMGMLVADYVAALTTIAEGNYDNAHDCKAAARIAQAALSPLKP